MMDPLELANPLQGTDSTHAFSRGNTWPLVGVPRGMTYWTPQTTDGRFTFNRRAVKLTGFRATHAPSPWMGDYGHFDVMPIVGPVGHTPAARGSSYDPAHRSQPHRYAARLLRYGIDAELTATARCAVMRFVFPADAADPAIVFQGGLGEAGSEAEFAVRPTATGSRVLGIARANHGGVPEGFGCYVVADIEGAEVADHGTFCARRDSGGSRDPIAAPRAGVFVRLRAPAGAVNVRIATSFISHAQAEMNLHHEVGDRAFERVADDTAERWRGWFGRVEPIGGRVDHRQRLYSAMYRVGLFPTAMHERDEQGRPIHYSPYDGRVHPGVLYTNYGFWDTHRTACPLLALIDPEGYGEIIEGFLQAYRQSGWLPTWASPGHRNCMVGTHADSAIAEAIARDVPGFDYAEAYEALRRNAFEVGDPGGRFGRAALTDYLNLGYVPSDTRYSVSQTLDFAYSDWCVAQVALRLGHEGDAADLLNRSRNYRHLWHAGSGFMRPRGRDGAWTEPWDEFTWGGPYIEGGPWQHSFNVPHDLRGLASLCGGVAGLVQRLMQMLATPPRFNVGSYGDEIHEMTEMARAVDDCGEHFGQYAHSNQPVHGVLWMLAALGEHEFAAHHVRRVAESLYTPLHLPGDEDNGEMSAWYVFAAMGRYPLCPGSGKLVACDPGLFDEVRVPAARAAEPRRATPQIVPSARLVRPHEARKSLHETA